MGARKIPRRSAVEAGGDGINLNPAGFYRLLQPCDQNIGLAARACPRE